MNITRLVALSTFLLLVTTLCHAQKVPSSSAKRWTDTFGEQKNEFSTEGENRYFILKTGYTMEFEGIEKHDTTHLTITVLAETKMIGDVETRVVEERETVNSRLVEVSRNYFALCTRTNSIFYFGEDVDMYKNGRVSGHEGSWRADSGNARPGVMMPGIVLIGSRYYQEVAPGVAMDRAEIIDMRVTVRTAAGTFSGCLKTEETTPLEPDAKEYKYYAPGIGLVKDGNLLLKKYGFGK